MKLGWAGALGLLYLRRGRAAWRSRAILASPRVLGLFAGRVRGLRRPSWTVLGSVFGRGLAASGATSDCGGRVIVATSGCGCSASASFPAGQEPLSLTLPRVRLLQLGDSELRVAEPSSTRSGGISSQPLHVLSPEPDSRSRTLPTPDDCSIPPRAPPIRSSSSGAGREFRPGIPPAVLRHDGDAAAPARRPTDLSSNGFRSPPPEVADAFPALARVLR